MRTASVVFLFISTLDVVLGLSARRIVLGPAPGFPTNGDEKCQSVLEWFTTEDGSNYASRPEEAEWQARLEDAVRKGAEDPCSATIQATIGPTVGAGFGSRMSNFINEFAVAIVSGFPISLNIIPGDGMLNEVWPKDFVNVANLSVCKQPISADHECAFLAGIRMAERLNIVDHAYIEKLKRFIVPLVYTYTPETQARLDAALAAWLPAGGAPYVGVHIRHGDKAREGHGAQRSFVSTQLYGLKIKELDGGSPRPVFLATDDLDAKDALQAELGPGYSAIAHQPQLPEEAYTTRSYDEATAFAVMADVEALRRADLFIGTASSNLGRLVWFIRDPSLNSSSLDLNSQWMVLGGLQTRRPSDSPVWRAVRRSQRVF